MSSGPRRRGRTGAPAATIAEAFGISRSEARRLIDQGGVTLDGLVLAKGDHDVAVERADGQC